VDDRAVTGRRRSARRPLVIGIAAVAVVLVIGGATAFAVSDSGNSGYRMAKVIRTSIENNLDVVGTVEPVNDASSSFQVSGQVATVTATVGQKVTAGQILATLDTTALSEAVASARSSLESDDAKLTQDEDSQTSSGTTNTATSTTTTTSTTAPASPSPSSGGPSGKAGSTGTAASQVTLDQAYLVTDQVKASNDEQQEAADLSQAVSTCESSSSTTTPTSTTPTSTSTTTTNNDGACATELEQVSTDQQTVAVDQQTVATDESNLSKALTAEESQSQSQSSSSSPSNSSSTGTKLPTTPSANSDDKGSTAGGSAASSTPSDSASQIASDQATIDTAEASLVEAQQSLNDAQLTSPIAGTIASVAITAGGAVSAGSSTETIVIIGTQAFEATSTLTSTQVNSVKVGQTAEVAVDGTTKPIAGTVSQVGPVQVSDDTYSYPVVVALSASAKGLFSGSSANISILTSEVENVLAVPTSAVITDGTRSYVLVFSSGSPVEKAIKVGVVGDIYTQVISGLKVDRGVILADYSEAVPASNSTTIGGFGGAGGFGGTGGFGGGGGRFTVNGGPVSIGG
jgi:multidrug efflux pump subunit AcrA (membrane-fusion protein)